MGRELRRVALDFDWSHNRVWWGYLNEHYDAWENSHKIKCSTCGGKGRN